MEKKSLEDLRINYKSLEINLAHHMKKIWEADVIHSFFIGFLFIYISNIIPLPSWPSTNCLSPPPSSLSILPCWVPIHFRTKVPKSFHCLPQNSIVRSHTPIVYSLVQFLCKVAVINTRTEGNLEGKSLACASMLYIVHHPRNPGQKVKAGTEQRQEVTDLLLMACSACSACSAKTGA